MLRRYRAWFLAAAVLVAIVLLRAADECLQRRQDRTQRRLTNACKALAQIRKLLGPNIQINVAEQQVNVTS